MCQQEVNPVSTSANTGTLALSQLKSLKLRSTSSRDAGSHPQRNSFCLGTKGCRLPACCLTAAEELLQATMCCKVLGLARDTSEPLLRQVLLLDRQVDFGTSATCMALSIVIII